MAYRMVRLTLSDAVFTHKLESARGLLHLCFYFSIYFCCYMNI